VQARLEASPEKPWSLNEMERTGGQPDVVAHDKKSGEFVFFDCSAQSPAGRTSLCYDHITSGIGAAMIGWRSRRAAASKS
jgi:hypothetical protein